MSAGNRVANFAGIPGVLQRQNGVANCAELPGILQS